MRTLFFDIEISPLDHHTNIAYVLYNTSDEKDWEQTRFVSRADNPPSEAKRAKLRAKRKK
jgi:hypothetical protein